MKTTGACLFQCEEIEGSWSQSDPHLGLIRVRCSTSKRFFRGLDFLLLLVLNRHKSALEPQSCTFPWVEVAVQTTDDHLRLPERGKVEHWEIVLGLEGSWPSPSHRDGYRYAEISVTLASTCRSSEMGRGSRWLWRGKSGSKNWQRTSQWKRDKPTGHKFYVVNWAVRWCLVKSRMQQWEHGSKAWDCESLPPIGRKL